MSGEQPLLVVHDLHVEYRKRGQRVAAVAGVSLAIAPGETLGLVGESGSGKTTVGRAILGLTPVSGGRISFAGQDITRLRGRARRALARDMQVVFQDPYSSLNPAMPVSAILAESLRARGARPARETAQRVREALEQVALPATAASRYPATFSGGQRQRLAIARALMPTPRLVICDEAVTALDVSVQAQILNLLRELQREHAFCYLFIGHDLDVVRFMSHRVMVLYRGRVMEHGPAGVVARHPRHPYTQALLAAAPGSAKRPASPGADTGAPPIPPPQNPAGCPFAPRCPHAIDICATAVPPLVPARDGGAVACHRYPELALCRNVVRTYEIPETRRAPGRGPRRRAGRGRLR
jgi:oligopeptide/dipeptide ABC transporter ATP-binding protein